MEFLKELFTEGVTYETFQKACTEKGIKLADLSKGEYVAKDKLDKEIEKTKGLNEQIKTLNTEMQGLKDGNATADEWKNKAGEWETKYNQLEADNKAKAEAEEAAKEDALLTEAISAVFTDKKFTSDYVKNGIISDMKAEIAKDENKGKGYKDIFEALTKDKPGIFESNNPPGRMGRINQNDDNAEVSTLTGALKEKFS